MPHYYLTRSSVSQLSADHSGLQLIPEVITHCTVCVVLTDLNTTLPMGRPSNQPNITIRTIFSKIIKTCNLREFIKIILIMYMYVCAYIYMCSCMLCNNYIRMYMYIRTCCKTNVHIIMYM